MKTDKNEIQELRLRVHRNEKNNKWHVNIKICGVSNGKLQKMSFLDKQDEVNFDKMLAKAKKLLKDFYKPAF